MNRLSHSLRAALNALVIVALCCAATLQAQHKRGITEFARMMWPCSLFKLSYGL